MRNIVIIFLLTFLWSCTSCNENNPQNDTVTDIDLNSDSDTEYDESSDKVPDTELDEMPDLDEEECLPLLIDAPFPDKDNEGNITFCRPGCDTPSEKDPQCMSNLWKEQNEALCTLHPAHDCCGYPCVNEYLKPVTEEELIKEHESLAQYIPMHECDLMISPFEWSIDGTAGVVKSWNMSDGKVGFKISPVDLSVKEWPVKIKYVSYDIETQKYNFITPSRGQEQSYFKGNRIGLVADARSLDLNNSNIFLAYIGDDGKKELVFNSKVNFLAYEPALNDKWAFVNLRETKNSPYKMMYSKVGEWSWKALGEGTARYTSLSDNYLGICDEAKNGYICDLSKSPQSFSDCIKINKDGERMSLIKFNRENPKEFIFNLNGIGIVKGTIGSDKIESYENVITDFTEESAENSYTLSPYGFKGNLILYVEITSDGSFSGGRLCYYRLDKKKKYCMNKMDRDTSYEDGSTMFPYGFSEFEGKWLLYQKLSSTPLILRDMECYCKEEGICPFEE